MWWNSIREKNLLTLDRQFWGEIKIYKVSEFFQIQSKSLYDLGHVKKAINNKGAMMVSVILGSWETERFGTQTVWWSRLTDWNFNFCACNFVIIAGFIKKWNFRWHCQTIDSQNKIMRTFSAIATKWLKTRYLKISSDVFENNRNTCIDTT